MKRIITALLTFAILLSLAACGWETIPVETLGNEINQAQQPSSSNDTNVPNNNLGESVEVPSDSSFSVNLEGITTLDELEVRVEEHLDSVINALISQWETLSAEIDTYEKYCANTETVSAFYQTVIDETEKMCIMLYEYSAVYVRMILDSDMSADDKYDAVDGINDCLYKKACDEINDEIYDGILDDMNDYFYEGVLDDAQDNVDYSDWYDVCSEEYSQWYDTSSKVYGLYYDTASDIYSLYYDLSSELYSRDFDRAEKIYEKFVNKIAKLKGLNTGGLVSNALFDTTLRNASSIEELEIVVDAHVSECVQALFTEWEILSSDIDTFEKYTANVDAVEEFHSYIEDSASQILVMICEYGISYTEIILNTDASTKDKYKNFEDFKDCIYEDACDIVKEEIYEGLLKEIKDYYYDGIINDAKDDVKYSDWSDARGDTYGWWSDARGEVYGDWSDARGDLYSFYSDIRSELYSGDADGAFNELQDFMDKVARMK